MRIEIKLRPDDPSLPAIKALPPGERAQALRLLIRKHSSELGSLLGFRYPPKPIAPAAPEPPAKADTEPAPAQSAQSILDRIVQQAKGMQHAVALGFGGLLAAALLALAPTTNARAGTLDLDVNVASVHTEAWARRNLNQVNPGAGITYHWNRTWSLAGGVYRGSYRRPVYYAQAEWTPLHIGSVGRWHIDAGAMAGIATYTRAEVACAPFAAAALVRIVAPDGVAADIVAVPNQGPRQTGFIGLQLSIPLR